MVKLGFFN